MVNIHKNMKARVEGGVVVLEGGHVKLVGAAVESTFENEVTLELSSIIGF